MVGRSAVSQPAEFEGGLSRRIEGRMINDRVDPAGGEYGGWKQCPSEHNLRCRSRVPLVVAIPEAIGVVS